LSVLGSKLKEVFLAVFPITALVVLLNFIFTSLDTTLLARFLIGAVFIVFGLSIFLFGVDLSISPIGNAMGSMIVKYNKLWIIILGALILGFIISIAEPDLHILAGQVDSATGGAISKMSLVIVVSVGISFMIALGFLRIVYNLPLYIILSVLYFIILVLSIMTSSEFLAISFDASGATTGAVTVPFILALAMGIATMKKNSKASEKDSFGLVGIASAGAIIAVLIMSIISQGSVVAAKFGIQKITTGSIMEPFINKLPLLIQEVFLALLPIVIIFLILQKFSLKLSKRVMRRILFGLMFTFVGMVLFLAGVNAGFMDAGRAVGYALASVNKISIVIIGLVLGFLTILAEPAVYVLTHQIEDVTSGYVKRKIVLFTLAIGVGVAVALSMMRIIIPKFQLWHCLLPGYVIAIALMYFSPKLFVGIAFDSGGVASGPMTATFILAFAQGAAEATQGANVLVDAFGMIALVAMMPLISLQILGLIFKIKSRKGERIDNA